MDRVIVATCVHEGHFYSPDKNQEAPIRFYSDGSIEDDFLRGGLRRECLSREQLATVVFQAEQNRLEGRI